MSEETLNGLTVRRDASPPSAELDMTKYLAEIEDVDLTDAQKAELLETLWSVMCMMVELGFTVDLCEQLLGEFNQVSDGRVGDARLD